MRNKKLLVFTYILFGISIILAMFMIGMVFYSIFAIKTAPSVIVFLLLCVPSVLLVGHYWLLVNNFRNAENLNDIKRRKLIKSNNIWIGLSSFNACAMLTVTLYPLVFYGFEILKEATSLAFFVYFLSTFLVGTTYAINLILLNRHLTKYYATTPLEQTMKTTLQHYKFQSKPELADIIDDAVTFAVLKKILNFDCTDIFTNGKSVIVCYSNAPYPVWVWCKSPYDAKDVEMIVDTLQNEFLDKGNFRFIISEDLLAELAKTHHVFAKMTEKMQLFSYKLTKIKNIDYRCDGRIRKAEMAEADRLAKIYQAACLEMQGFDFSIEQCKNKIVEMVANEELFVWENGDGDIVATASKSVDGVYAKIALVYTLPSHRRKGYAINLVHGVSKTLLESGLTPTLYTDGHYVASNECYKKIGYEQVGKLLDVEKKG